MIALLQGESLWIVTWLLMALGVIGTVLPMVPGQILIVAAAGFHWWAQGEDSHLGWWTLLVLGGLFVISLTLEYLSGAMGARVFGGSGWGIVGAILGGLGGLFFLPFGLVLGPLLGAFGFEWIFAKKKIAEATRAGVGSAVGTVMGMGIEVGMALVMAGYLVVDLFWI